ncbi:stabilin-1 [Spea bombifrons]|uniref:stabilin-1 n=1 Tax=Spea bombifrons TaxID=233779 RepID=UPI00234ACBC2|nr:stabilin-1 [Spea bombifrons]
MTACRLFFVLFITYITRTFAGPQTKSTRGQCDVRTVVTMETECTQCAANVRRVCPRATKVTSGIGQKGCRYTVDMGGLTLSLTGCSHTCQKTIIKPECCKGYWGPLCQECPGGAANPCNGHGTCVDGRNGNGTCVCDHAFTGFSCSECADELLYGSNCDSACECHHGICNNGVSGNGNCLCEAGYTGANCDQESLPCKALNCGQNTHCANVRGILQCQCLPGYSKRGGTCQPDDPCKSSSCSYKAVCKALPPHKPLCTCKPDFIGNGETCFPFNPCTVNNGGCVENSTRCTYLGPGKSSCSCLGGTSRGKSGACLPRSTCFDISCDKSAQCEPLPSGTNKCVCQQGEIGDGRSCYGSILYQLNKLRFEDLQMREKHGALRLFTEGCEVTLRKYGPITVFVPYMKFQGMNETVAKLICKAHIVPGQHLTADALRNQQLWTLSGDVLKFSNKEFIKLSEPNKSYKLLKYDLPASNGVIHFIDKPMTTGNRESFGNQTMTIGDILAKYEQFNRFEILLENCGLPPILNGHGSFTVFVPSNKAVDSLRDGRLFYLLTQGKHKLLDLVKYHIASMAAVTADRLITMPQILTSANDVIKINITENGRIVLGDSEVPLMHSDIIASNGVIHVLDGIFIPPSILPILPHRCTETRHEVVQGVCSACDTVLSCPEGTADLGTINNKCSLGNGTSSAWGCARNCNLTVTELGCCSGFYGPSCQQCPGGFSNPCYGRGTCADGVRGTGRCSCLPQFKGIACHICMDQNKHGENCEEDCRCVHGYCDNRPGSGGVCQGGRCEGGFTGKFCDQMLHSCGSLNLSQNCHFNASCEAAESLTRCVCNNGYEGDGLSCQPVDLCRKPERGGCSENAICRSVGPGLVTCECNPGWTGDGIACLPIDNCALESRGGCHINAECSFTQPGQNDCTCKRGYMGDGYACEAVDPCLEDNGGCHDMAQCMALAGGGRSCVCPAGWEGDGLTCYGDIFMELLRLPQVAIFNQWLKNSLFTIPKGTNVTALIPSDVAIQALAEHQKIFWLDVEKLPFLIRAHFLRGSFISKQLKQLDGQELSTFDPRTKWAVSVIDGNPFIHNASFLRSDIPAANGFIFIIDKVLIPPAGNVPPPRPSLSQLLDQVQEFEKFKEVLHISGVIEEVESSGQKYTIFVPNDSAMEKFYRDCGAALMDNNTIRYHIIPGEKLSRMDLKSGIHKASLLGPSYWLTFYERDDRTFVHDVPLVGSFFETKNGIVMGISKVLSILRNRCDVKNTVIKKTKCMNCDKQMQCPDGTALQEAPENGREKCTFKKRNKHLRGCRFQCISETVAPECCSGYFGHQCLMCPGGANNSCSNNGDCQDGVTGNGECICKEGFHGTACESCEPGRYGKDCKSDCDCVHGRCDDGLTGDGTCRCDKGWSGYSCETDIENDLCNGTCSVNANCIAGAGNSSASCSCIAGFAGNGTHCAELDACSVNNGGCSEFANCTGLLAGETSCTCAEGFTGDGVVCLEIDGCLEHNGGCHLKAECIKTGPNKVACNCLPRHVGDGVNKCELLDLCLENNGGCSPFALCSTTLSGERLCKCKRGFTGDGFTCAGKVQEVLRYNPEAAPFYDSLQEQHINDLTGLGPFTVFVPQKESVVNSSAFKEWKSKDLLKDLLRYHMVGCGKLLLGDLEELTSLTSLSGERVRVSSKQDGVYLNDFAKITRTDIIATNGVVHFIDNVLFPERNVSVRPYGPNITDVAERHGYFVFSRLLQESRLLPLVNDKIHQPFTMLWPTDEAFNSLPEERKQWLYHEDHRDKLVAYLKVHMIRNTKIIAANLPQAKSLRTLHGSTVSFTCSRTNVGDIMVDENNGRIIQRHMEFGTGIAHGIDQLLEPPDIGARCDEYRSSNIALNQRCGLCGFEYACPEGTMDSGRTRQCSPRTNRMRYWNRHRMFFNPHYGLGYCKKICYSVDWQPECCRNHYGKDCHVCPGGLEAPCSKRGTCSDGMAGTGVCSCSQGFEGTACELCAPGRYGPDCKGCNCTENGVCNDGVSGDGWCFCNENWAGEKCEIRLDVKPVCSPACHGNATCRLNNTCECSPYYEGDGRSCSAIDLCKEDNGGCSAHATCSQSGAGPVTCGCLSGYEGDGFVCIEVDLCADGFNGGCSEHATCIYTGPNTRRCECHEGFVGNGVQCLEKAIPPADRCLQNNGDCHPVATCADLHFQEKLAGVFHYRSPRGQYKLTYPQAVKGCASEGATIATFSQLSAAQQLGFHLCSVGWLHNQTAGYPTAYASPSCGSGHVGIVDYKKRMNGSEEWDVFCYRVQDVRCSCPEGYVGDGSFCNGNLLEVLEAAPNLSYFFSMLINYANDSERGAQFLEYLSNGTSFKTLFVPEDSSLEKNLTLTWRDLEHHVSQTDVLLSYGNLTSGIILLSRLGFNLTISVPASNSSASPCSKVVNDRNIIHWDIPAFNGILHVINGPLIAPLVQEADESHATPVMAVSLVAAVLAASLLISAAICFFYRRQTKGFRFRRFKSEDDDDDGDTAEHPNPLLVSIPNPVYGESGLFHEAFEEAGGGGMRSDSYQIFH